MELLQNDVLILDQVTSFLSNDFAISDAQGRQIGHIHTEGSGLSRIFMGNRRFTVMDASGQPVVLLDDVVSLGRDRMNIMTPDGGRLAELVRKVTFFRPKFSLNLADGTEMQIDGNFMQREYTLQTEQMGQIARISRSYQSFTKAFLGHERYSLEIAGFVEPWLRATIIGAVIAVDLCRLKDQSD